MKLNKFEYKIYSEILENNLIKENDKVLVAVSSGSDSMCLVNVLNNIKNQSSIKFEIYIAHINHSLRDESEEEYEYLKKYSDDNNIKLFYLKIDANKESIDNKMGVEEISRKLRYDFFDKICMENKFNKVAIAHNKNDNIETIIFNILRGSSLKGIVGMELSKDKYIRPLLNISKSEIESYCKDINLKYYNDKSNFINDYTRNKIRLDLIPYLKKEFNSNIEESILRLSKTAKQSENFINSYTYNIIDDIILEIKEDSIYFDYNKLILYNEYIVSKCIFCLINKLIDNVQGIGYVHISDIVNLLKKGIKNKKYIIGNKFTVEIKGKNKAVIYK